jgi:ABC-type nickel/cobalt efflux system permease component RcnA
MPPRRLLALVLAPLVVTTHAVADPFNGARVVPSSAGTAWLMPSALIDRLAQVQMQLNDVISREFQSVHGADSRFAVLAILGLAFLYGAVHATVPGHGKSVVGSYFVANDAHWSGGVIMGGLISLLKGVSAIAIVFVLSMVLHLKETATANQSAVISSVSYALVGIIACVALWRAATGRDCGHSHGFHMHRDGRHDADKHGGESLAPAGRNFQRLLVIFTGLAPCSSGIIVLLFALANNALGIGIAAVVAMSLGMAVTVSMVGTIGIVARPLLISVVGGTGHRIERAERTVRLLGAAAMVGFAGLLMLSSLAGI